MTPETRQRLLTYAQTLVDRKVNERTYFAGDRATITDRLISLQLKQSTPVETTRDVWIRVWAEFTITQTSDPSSSVPYPNTTFSSPAFPVFTLYPGSNEPARKNQLDQFDLWLENTYTLNNTQTGLLYPNSSVPLILAQNGSSWGQSQFPPFLAVYPGFQPPPNDLYNPYRIGGPQQIFESDVLVQTVSLSASVRLYVRGHSWETLSNFELGGASRRVKLTLRQVGTQENPNTPGTGVATLVSVQDASVGYNGESFNFSPTSTWPTTSRAVTETVGLVGFELR